MLRSMYSGVSGLRGYQTMIDVVGNNIANVNTIGFKGGQTVFQDLLSQTLQGAGLPAQGGGTNPAQIGLGMRLAGTTTNFGQGGLQNTGRPTDLSIQGDGFFIVRRGTDQFYTRAGSFTLDGNGRLSSPQGTLVQGWTSDAQGVINTNGPVGDINMPVGALIQPKPTANVTVGGNLPSNATPSGFDGTSYTTTGTQISTTITVYDDNGAGKSLVVQMTRDAVDADDVTPPGVSQRWLVMLQADVDPALLGAENLLTEPFAIDFDMTTGKILDILTPNDAGMLVPAGGAVAGATPDVPNQTITFDADALEDAGGNLLGTFTAGETITLNFGGLTPLTQFSAVNSLSATGQDGSAPGALQTFTIASDGTITGVFSNGRTQSIAQIALANFANPAGLEKLEGSMYRPTANSGLATFGIAGIAGRGTLAGGTLEMSNVDLAQEFTNLIVAQRGFQASTKVITASDEILNDLVNIRR
jgi:flagellar hook protein FlgE